jgi:SAM-dependent methyltransferase
MTILNTLGALSRPLVTDRILPPKPGAPPEAFEALYARRPDPWGVLTSPLAQQRYLTMVEAVSAFSPCRSILDVGCGEGALTRYLVGCATNIAGIDASQTAIARARQLVPRASFQCATLDSYVADQIFDVVLAVEMLYYVPSVPVAIEKLLTLGRALIISYTSRERRRLEPYLDAYCGPDQRVFHSFFGLARFGFTVAIVRASERTQS